MLSNLAKLAAEKAIDAAEAYFKLQNIDMAVKSLQAAKDFNPHLPNLNEYFTAYKVHDLAEKKSTWYELLGIGDPEIDTTVIRSQYKKLALLLHPDKNPSVAAEGAFKIIGTAVDVLTNPEKRRNYDTRFGSKKAKSSDSSCSPSPPPTPTAESREDGTHHHKAKTKKQDPPRPSYSCSCSCRKNSSSGVEINVRDGSKRRIIMIRKIIV